jgi:hypothetical protein
MTTYRIVRLYFNTPGQGRTIKRGLTLEEAQEHCGRSDTSSRTCAPSRARRIGGGGPWFDGYEEEHGT